MLDATLATETEHWVAAERARIAGRLAEVAARRVRLAEMVREAKLQMAELEATASYARFPLDVETEVTTLGGELAQARSNAKGAETRWQAAVERLRPVRSRRAEIAAGIAAIGPMGELDADIGERSQRLRGELIAVAGAARRTGGDDAREGGAPPRDRGDRAAQPAGEGHRRAAPQPGGGRAWWAGLRRRRRPGCRGSRR